MKTHQGDLFRGLRMFAEPSGRLRLEGTVRLAAQYTGLSPRRIHDYIESGEIEARAPGAHTAAAKEPDAMGRRRGFKMLVNMRDVFRLAYGEERARELLRELGVG
jgi:hypothetical protein